MTLSAMSSCTYSTRAAEQRWPAEIFDRLPLLYLVESGVPVADYGVRGVPIDQAAIDNAGGDGPWSHLVAAPQ